MKTTYSADDRKGALPAETLHELCAAGFIKSADVAALSKNIRPSSLDLSVSNEVYKVEGIFQPKSRETVRQVLDCIRKTRHPILRPLERNQMYLIRLNETLALPEVVYGLTNPKSTSGRIDVHVRLLADGVSRYDYLPAGFRGELWISIMPKSFPVKLYEGVTLNQLRLFNADTRLNDFELEVAFKKHKLLWRRTGEAYTYEDILVRDHDGSVILTLDLEGTILGWEGVPNTHLVDLAKISFYDAKKFFKPVKKKGDYVYLKKGSFYILSTHEYVRVPPEFACEMVPMDERSGEFRSHYAGFIDPGWGWGKAGEGKGRPLTLEVRPFEDLIVRQGQPIAKIRFEKVTEAPREPYDTLNPNYARQTGPKLAKHFKN